MTIQEALMLQQLQYIGRSPLATRIIGDHIPRNLAEFRHLVPLTSYQDYLPELEMGDEGFLAEKPFVWAHTSRDGTSFKRIPYTEEFYHRALDNLMSVFILSCSKRKGQSSIAEGDKVLYNVAPRPYLSGILATGATENFGLRSIMSPDSHDGLDFKEKVKKGFDVSLRTGVDILIAMTSVLVKMGNDFDRLSRGAAVFQNTCYIQGSFAVFHKPICVVGWKNGISCLETSGLQKQ